MFYQKIAKKFPEMLAKLYIESMKLYIGSNFLFRR